MSAAIRKAIPAASVELIQGAKGEFTVVADGEKLWDKHETGSFPEEPVIVARLRAKTG